MFQVSTTPSSSSSQQSRFRMRSTNAVLSVMLLWSCCGCVLWPHVAAKATGAVAEEKSGGVGGAASAPASATSYLDINGVKNGATLVAASASADVAEDMLQLPHAFRHQEHYSHRIEQAVNDFKRAQLQQRQQLEADASNTTKALVKENKKKKEWPPLEQQQEEHHRRHEQQQQHLKQHHQQHPPHHESQPQHVEVPQHHLRHHNRHHETWEQRVFPSLRHQRHERKLKFVAGTAATNLGAFVDGASNEPDALPLSTLNVTHALQTRYFDRDSLYRNARVSSDHAPSVWTRTTRGPHSRHHYGNEFESSSRSVNHADRAFGDDPLLGDAPDGETDYGTSSPLSGKRFSLKLTESETDLAENDVGKATESPQASDVDVNDGDDDYMYEDTITEELPRMDELDASSAKAKVAVKRYTNPFASYKGPAPKRFELAYDDADYRSDDKQADYDDNQTNNNDNRDVESSEESAESDFETVYSSDKWSRIEHQHHLKQQQHQRELQRRLQYAPGSNKYTASTATGAAQRQIKNDDDMQNIFSRNYIPGALTRQKQDELGTLEAVQQTRRNHVLKHTQNKALANAHAKQIFSEASCRLPQRRVERIQRDPTKIYTPHCTVLHRCADDTGCCKSDRQTCAPKRTKSVDLYFFVKSINDRRGSIERLTFINHTECHCVEKAKQQPAEYGSAPLYGAGPNTQMLRRATVLNCNCPRLYEKILQEDGFCRCDCSSGNTGCDWLKRGMEHFSMMDRKCISEGRCKPPTCAYGGYMKKHGRCSRREEQLSTALTGGGSTPLTTNSIRSRVYH